MNILGLHFSHIIYLVSRRFVDKPNQVIVAWNSQFCDSWNFMFIISYLYLSQILRFAVPKPITFVTCVRVILVWEQIPWLWFRLTTFLGEDVNSRWFFLLLTECTISNRLKRAPDKSMSPEVGTDNLVPQFWDRGRCLEVWCWRKTKMTEGLTQEI